MYFGVRILDWCSDVCVAYLSYSYLGYRLVLRLVVVLLLAVLYLLFNKTRYGFDARATIQLKHMAKALGVNAGVFFSLTFVRGAALAGLAGGLYAPTMT